MKYVIEPGVAWVAAALLIGFFVTGCATPRTTDLPAAEAEASVQIERRLREIFIAAENRDFTRLESYHLYDRRFTRFSGSSPTRMDASATRQLEREGLASLRGLKMQANMLKIDVFGTTGIATFILDYSFEMGATSVRKQERSTLVFVRESGEWRIVHEHLSPVIPAESGA